MQNDKLTNPYTHNNKYNRPIKTHQWTTANKRQTFATSSTRSSFWAKWQSASHPSSKNLPMALWTRNTKYFASYIAQNTVGIDFIAKNVTYKDSMYRLQLWDTAGQERFRSLIPGYMRDAHCAVIVYDVSNRATFDNCKTWFEFFRLHRNA